MAFLEASILRSIVAIWAHVLEFWSSFAFLSARPKTIPKICDANHEKALPSWILDSGASFHALGDKSLLSPRSGGLRTAGAADAIYKARDGRVLTVAGVGTVSCANFHLPDVLYVPDLRSRVILVSVQQLAERDYLVVFGGGQCSVKDLSSGKIVGKGRLHDDDALYHLEFLDITPDTAARACVTAAP